MKKILSFALLLLAASGALAQTYPSPTFQNLTVLGTVTAPAGSVSLPSLATQAANTIVANATGALASPTAVAMPSCSASGDALNWTSATGPTCQSLTAHTFGLGTTDTPTFYGITINGSTQHGLIVGGGNGNPATYTSAGTSGYVLTSNGASADPTFQSAASLGLLTNAASVNSTAQTASISTTTAYAVPSGGAGVYLIIVDMICTTAGTGGTVSASLGWNNGAATGSTASGPISLSTLGNETTQILTVYSAASQNITYSTTVSAASGSPQYSLRIRLVYLG